MMRAVLYCRVSTKEQTHNLSLPTQQKAEIEYCQRQGWEVDRIFIEAGESAKTADRTEFQKLLNYCRENKGRIHFVVVYAINRFARNKHDHFAVRAFLYGLGITLRSVTEPIDETSIGKLMEGILAAYSQFDNDVKAERTKEGMKAALQTGRWVWNSRLGFLRNKAPKGQANIVPDPERAPLVKKAFELVATGRYTRPQVLKMVTELGLRTIKGHKVSLQTFEDMLRCPLYAGLMHSTILDAPEHGTYEPIIEKALFEQVQAVMDGRKHQVTPYQRNHPDFPLRNFVRCGQCNRPLTASWSRGRKEKYAHYRCFNRQCRAVNIRKSDLEMRFVDYLTLLQPQRHYVDLFNAIVQDTWKERQAHTTVRESTLQKRIEDLKRRKDQLVEAYIYKHLIDKDTYEGQLDKIKQDLMLAEMEWHESKLETFDIEAALCFAQYVITNAARLWVEMSLDQKQRLQKVLFPKSVTFLNGGFGTAETCIFFKMLQISAAQKSEVASLF